MTNSEEIRWHYRFRNFSRAYTLLSEALEREVEELNELEREGAIQRFEYTFQLAWLTLKDRLELRRYRLHRSNAAQCYPAGVCCQAD